MKRRFIKNFSILALALVLTVALLGIKPGTAHAAYTSSDLISDPIFADSGVMTATDIQNFLNNMNSGIKNLTDVESCSPATPTLPDPYASSYYPRCGQTLSAAQLIYDAAQSYGVSPRVILATMQKEQSLITDPTPWQSNSSAVNCAMGYLSCGSVSGFFEQVDNGTWQLRTYVELMNGRNWWGYSPSSYPCGSAGYIQAYNSSGQSVSMRAYSAGLYPNTTVTFDNPAVYGPSGAAGGLWGGKNPTVPKTFNVASSATAGLYCYTPYVGPYSETGYSGSYNFVTWYETWWGPTHYFNGNIVLSTGLTIKDASTGTTITNGSPVYAGETLAASYIVSNTGTADTLAGGLGICSTLNGKWYDFGYADQTNVPGSGSVTVQYSKKLDAAGALNVSVCSYHASLGGWASSFYPYTYSSGQPRSFSSQSQENPLMVSSVTFSSPDGPLSVGQTITASVTLHNYAPSAVSIGPLTLAARDMNNYNADFSGDPNATILAGADKQFSFTRFIYTPGPYKYWLTNLHNGSWDTAYPLASNGSLTRGGTFIVQNNPTIISPVTFSPSSTPLNQQITASFTIHNFGDNPVDVGTIVIAARDKNGYNADFSYITPNPIAAHSSYTYNGTRTMVTPGNYTYWIANFKNNAWNSTYPLSASWVNVNRSGLFTVQ